jgi:nucleotide-binding universal stress UspA family protein
MRILVATDGSRYAQAAARFLARFVPGPGKHVDALAVVPKARRSDHRSYGQPAELRQQWRAVASKWVDGVTNTLSDRGYDVTKMIRSGLADRQILDQLRRERYDLVVAGAKGRADTPFFDVGSVTLALLEQAPTSVLLVREREPKKREQEVTRAIRPMRVLVATDGTPKSDAAIDRFMAVFEEPNTEITVLSVQHPLEEVPEEQAASAPGLEHASRTIVHHAANRLAPSGAAVATRVLDGEPGEAVHAAAEEAGADLIVLGSRGVLRGERARQSSVALRIARLSPCSVLVVRTV